MTIIGYPNHCFFFLFKFLTNNVERLSIVVLFSVRSWWWISLFNSELSTLPDLSMTWHLLVRSFRFARQTNQGWLNDTSSNVHMRQLCHPLVLPILQNASVLTTATFDVLPSQKPSVVQIENSLSAQINKRKSGTQYTFKSWILEQSGHSILKVSHTSTKWDTVYLRSWILVQRGTQYT